MSSPALAPFLAQIDQHDAALESCVGDLVSARGAVIVALDLNKDGPPLYLQTKCYQSLDNIIGLFPVETRDELSPNEEYSRLALRASAAVNIHKQEWTKRGLSFKHPASEDFLAFARRLKHRPRAPSPVASSDEEVVDEMVVDEAPAVKLPRFKKDKKDKKEEKREKEKEKEKETEAALEKERILRQKAQTSRPPKGPTTRSSNRQPEPKDNTVLESAFTGPKGNKRPRDHNEGPPRVFPDSSMLDFLDNRAVSNVYITDVLSRAHRALDAFRARAETEDSLREVLSDIKMHMVRAIHRISVEVSHFEALNKEFGLVRASLAQLSQPEASGSGAVSTA